MKEITLNTKLQELNLSKETIDYWNNSIVRIKPSNSYGFLYNYSGFLKIMFFP